MEEVDARQVLEVGAETPVSDSEIKAVYHKRVGELRRSFEAIKDRRRRTQLERELKQLEEARDTLLARLEDLTKESKAPAIELEAPPVELKEQGAEHGGSLTGSSQIERTSGPIARISSPIDRVSAPIERVSPPIEPAVEQTEVRPPPIEPFSRPNETGTPRRRIAFTQVLTWIRQEQKLAIGVAIFFILALVGAIAVLWSSAPKTGQSVPISLENAAKEQPWQNSLGMKFVWIAETQVWLSIWDTRVKDFEAFVADTNYDATGGMWSVAKDGWKQRGATWREPGFGQGPTHPVVGVNWNDAKKFCGWLTRREQGSGMLPLERVYRLPTDAEWSADVGLQNEVGTTPAQKNAQIYVFPWGEKWPLPAGTGNYAGEESKMGEEPSDWPVIKGYNDGYPRTSPVESFPRNANGLYDMGGNVWQWCEDLYDIGPARVLRGASWCHGKPDDLLSSHRASQEPTYRSADIGFRCVVAPGSSQ